MSDNFSVTVTLRGNNQLSQPVGQAQQSLRGLSQEATRTNAALGQLKTIGAGLFAGVSLAGVARMAEDLYATGMEAQRAENLFRSFGSQVGDTTALLENLRKATRGVVDDTALMSGASQLLSMGIAKNAEDVTHLTSIAATFAQAMGTDVAGALEQVSLIISNESYLRLDSLGIGSGQVRELANQYKAAGMDSAAAFAQAFMDVADQKMPQMAAVADATITPFQRLETSWDNLWTNLGDRFAQGVNGIVAGIEHLDLIIAGMTHGDLNAQALNTFQTNPLLGQYADFLSAGLPETTRGQMGMVMGGAFNLGIRPGDLTDDQLKSLINLQDQSQRAWVAEQVDAVWSAIRAGVELNTHALTSAPASAYYNPASLMASMQTGPYWSGWNTQQTAALGMWRGGEQVDYAAVGVMADMSERIRDAYSELFTLQSQSGGLFSREQADRAEQLYFIIQDSTDTLERMGADTSVVDNFRNMASNAEDWKTAIFDGADRLENMNLSSLFGQGSGGRLNEIDQAVLDQLRGMGYSGDRLDSAAQSMGIDSGSMTEMSAQFVNTVAPDLARIFNDLGPEAYNNARRAYDDYVANLRDQNENYTGTVPWDLIMQGAGITQGNGASGSYVVQPGDVLSAIAAQYHIPVGQFASMAGISNPNMIIAGQTLQWGSGFQYDPSMIANAGDVEAETARQQQIADDTAAYYQDKYSSAFETAADSLSSALTGIADVGVKIPVEFVITNLGWFGQMMAAATQAGGGTAPGSSNYNSRGGSSGSIGQFAGGHKPP